MADTPSHDPQPSTQPSVDQPRHHEFDGIVEYDNRLPNWFSALFVISILFAPAYIAYYHFSGAKLGSERLKADQAAAAEARAAQGGSGPLSEDALRGLSKNPDRIAKGKALFAASGCAACHGPEGTGLVGPNLRDRFWIYGSNMAQIQDVILNGRMERGMPKAALSADEIANVVIFMVDLNRQGEKPGKAIDPKRELEAPISY
jgi:cytochrome c oxidase cbb3-type subunit 3